MLFSIDFFFFSANDLTLNKATENTTTQISIDSSDRPNYGEFDFFYVNHMDVDFDLNFEN